MYILVRIIDNVIIGASSHPLCEQSCKQNGYNIFKIPNHEYHEDMIGTKLEGYEDDQ